MCVFHPLKIPLDDIANSKVEKRENVRGYPLGILDDCQMVFEIDVLYRVSLKVKKNKSGWVR